MPYCLVGKRSKKRSPHEDGTFVLDEKGDQILLGMPGVKSEKD